MPRPLHWRIITSNSFAAWHSASSPATPVRTWNTSITGGVSPQGVFSIHCFALKSWYEFTPSNNASINSHQWSSQIYSNGSVWQPGTGNCWSGKNKPNVQIFKNSMDAEPTTVTVKASAAILPRIISINERKTLLNHQCTEFCTSFIYKNGRSSGRPCNT